jgi:leucyl-tRNA synthetase
MFIGPWDMGGSWSSTGIEGVHRFINRVWNLIVAPRPEAEKAPSEEKIDELLRMTHKTIRTVTEDIEAFKFNTALASMMKYNNYLLKAKRTPVHGTEAWEEAMRSLVLMMAPLMPHVSEELWERMGGPYSVHTQPWPAYDEDLAADEIITLVVQIDGRLRARLDVPADVTEEEAREAALADDNVQRHLEGEEVERMIYVPGRLVNFVT